MNEHTTYSFALIWSHTGTAKKNHCKYIQCCCMWPRRLGKYMCDVVTVNYLLLYNFTYIRKVSRTLELHVIC